MSKYIKNPFVISGTFLLFSIVFVFIFFSKVSKDSLLEQVQHRQQLSVRMGSKLVENLINSVGKSILMISNNPTQEELDLFVDNWQSSGIVGITFLDKNGKVIKSSNILNLSDLGQDLSDRDYFEWTAKSTSKTYKVFGPILSKRGPSKGTYVIPIATAVFDKNQKFNGVLVSAVPLFNLSKDYLNDIKILDNSQIYLITKEGVIIFSDDQSILGKSYTEILSQDFLGKSKVFSVINEKLEEPDESKFGLVIPNLTNKSILEPYLISMASIHANDQIWKIVEITPQKELNSFVYDSLNKRILAIFVVAALFVGMALRYSRNSGYHEAVSNEHKIHGIDQRYH
jgi:C4-dicarboxylate-specific signal transduction histidine kinase